MQTQPCLLSALQYLPWKNQLKKYFVFLLGAPINVQFQRQTFSRKQPNMLTKKTDGDHETFCARDGERAK